MWSTGPASSWGRFTLSILNYYTNFDEFHSMEIKNILMKDKGCIVPECDNNNATALIPSWWPSNAEPKCHKPILNLRKYNANNHICSNSTFLEHVEECHVWIFENNNSIVSELNLGCQSWKTSLVGSIHNAGMIVSMMFAGWIADKIGRKPTAIICSIGGFVGIFKIFVVNYYVYIALEFFESVIASGLYTVAVVLLIEVGGETKRVVTGVIFSYAVYMGEILFALIAMGLRYWKYLVLFVYTPAVLFVSYTVLLRESTRWQILHGKMDDVKKTFKLTSRMNGLQLSDAEIDSWSDAEIRSKYNLENQLKEESMKDVRKSKELLTRLAVTSFCFFTSSFLYYGLIIHSVLLPGDKYTNFILTSVVSFPGDLLAFYTMNYIGRRITLQCGYLITAIFLVAQSFSPDHLVWLKIFLFLIGKFGVVICFTGIYTYSLELFPTSVRGSLLGWGNTAARFGSMLAPFTSLLVTQLSSLPSILFSSTAIISAVLLSFTPETKVLPLFDTIAQMEAYKT
ncbi:unnamed protein product [Chilo suppressalis]|uniref:Major facilitator superfamily (MFS) profile domain-containing protein n=1 Tax=Chilo suppressalis TaxID=168631 RepID=A0ABN8L581_CHISP|nr:unnamed protein product [Chilo suppressalis]